MRRPFRPHPLCLVVACVALAWVSLARHALADASLSRGSFADSLNAVQLPPAVFADGIADIGRFVEQCPTLDPALAQITSDFTIRRNGAIAALPFCSEPVSQMKTSMYSTELAILQALRMAYYMDRGQGGHLPWTPGTFYDWMKSKIAGIDVYDGGSGNSYCCERFDGRLYVAITSQVANCSVCVAAGVPCFACGFNAVGISGLVALLGHETRHVDGYLHTSCCGTPNGCDQSFDPSNLTAYGIQWWLFALYLKGAINVGFQCLAPAQLNDFVYQDEYLLADYRTLFCTNPPPVLPTPQQPGGPCGVPARSPCIENSETLCLSGGRFRVTATFDAGGGNSGQARPVPLSGDTGYLWFFGSSNVEAVVKVLNGCGLNSKYWVFAGGLTNVKVVMTVTDTMTGVAKTYTNPPNTTFRPIQDTSAFSCSGASAGSASPGVVARAMEKEAETLQRLIGIGTRKSEEVATTGCTPSSTALCLNSARFKVTATFDAGSSGSGDAQVVPLTPDTGYLWFFGSSNVEAVVKVLNGCGLGGHYWVFAGGLTNVNAVITVTDTQTGIQKKYTNPPNTEFQPIQDTNAFARCP